MAVMGFLQVVPLLWKFLKLVGDANRFFREQKPDAVVLVDFPGFNWWIARKAKAAGIPVFYYLPPQLWAWAPWRIRRVRKFVDHLLCALPFEKDWYAARGVQADYVGHPFFDEVADYPLDGAFLENWKSKSVRNVGILPGSRNHEISNHWPIMIDVMQRLRKQHADIRFLVAAYKAEHRDRCREMLRMTGIELPIHWFVGKTPEIIESAECCLMVSGSVSLEMLARKKPAVVIYRIGRLLHALMRPLVCVKSITLPNLIAGKVVLPEWLLVWFPKRDIGRVTAVLDGWLGNRQKRQAAVDELTELKSRVAETGATARTAELILERLSQTQSSRYDRRTIAKAA
jgi:lipid-A-disaccharide synthase